MLFPQGVADHFGQVVKANPHVTSGGAGEIHSPNLIACLGKVGVNAVRVEYLPVFPKYLRSFWINLEGSFLAYREPLLLGHFATHFISLLVCAVRDRRNALIVGHARPPLSCHASSHAGCSQTPSGRPGQSQRLMFPSWLPQ